MECVLHIGPSKTGSSSIQAFLKDQEEALEQQGIGLPRLSQMAVTELNRAFKTSFVPRNASMRLGLSRENYRQKQAEFLDKFAARFEAAHVAGMTKVILSAEGLSGLGIGKSDPCEVKNLRDWLGQHFSRVTVVPVLRRQDLRAVSRYKNLVKNNGWTERHSLLHAKTLDLDKFLGHWANEFSKTSIRPILFPDSVPESRDLLTDFCDVAGITGLYSPDQAPRFKRNASVDGRAIEIMRLMNLVRPGRHTEGSNKLLRRFYGLMDTHFETTTALKATPSRQEVEDFLACYEDSNRAVKDGYFPERAALFSDDLSRYPPEPCYPQVSPDDITTF